MNYHDESWFEVTPIDACHIILGRPWLLDREVVHDGYRNTYSFTKDGKRVTLASLTLSQPQKAKSQKTHDRLDLLLRCSEPIIKASYHEFKAFKE